MRKIKQNLFWAFIYNIIAIPIAAGVLYPINEFVLNPMIAGAAMAASSLTVALNTLIMRLYTPIRIRNADTQTQKPPPTSAESADEKENITQSHKKKNMETHTQSIDIQGMTCQNCVKHVTEAIRSVEGVSDVSVSLEEKNARIEGKSDIEKVKQAVQDAGYEVSD